MANTSPGSNTQRSDIAVLTADRIFVEFASRSATLAIVISPSQTIIALELAPFDGLAFSVMVNEFGIAKGDNPKGVRTVAMGDPQSRQPRLPSLVISLLASSESNPPPIR